MNRTRFLVLAAALVLLLSPFVALTTATATETSAGSHQRVPKVGLIIAMNLELQPYLSLLGLHETPSPFAWVRKQPLKLYEGTHNGIFYRAAWNGLCPYCNASYGVDQIQDQGAIPSVLALLADGFAPDLLVSAGATGGWSANFHVNDTGICANGRVAYYSDRNITDGNYGDYLYGWGNYPCATIPQAILDKNKIKLANIATHHSFVAPADEAARLTAWGADMVEEEGAAVAQQALINGIPFVKVGGVVNSYYYPQESCSTDTFFTCWNATCWTIAERTIGMLEDYLTPVHHH